LPMSIRCASTYTSGLFVPSLGGNPPSCRVNVVPGVSEHLSNQGPFVFGQTKAFNPAAFSEPANFTLGDAARVQNIRGWPNLDEDVSVEKRWTIHERASAVLRLDMFNMANRTTWGGQNNTGGIDTTIDTPSFGEYVTASGNRTMQMSLRVSF
jgi:hypothetical protein